MIVDYSTAAAYLGSKQDRPLPGRASRIIRRGPDTIAIRYQATDVVVYHAGGGATLNSGGWRTVTTKARFDEYTRAKVYVRKGVWFVKMGSWEAPAALYRDGMHIGDDGIPTAPTYPTPTDTQRKRDLDKMVARYIKGFCSHIAEQGLQDPSNGDCWGCLFKVQGAKPVEQGTYRLQKPTPHGRVEPLGVDHYRQHLQESYFVPSLLFNAITAAGYRDPALIWHMIARQKDAGMAARILRGYFRNLKPALLEVQP